MERVPTAANRPGVVCKICHIVARTSLNPGCSKDRHPTSRIDDPRTDFYIMYEWDQATDCDTDLVKKSDEGLESIFFSCVATIRSRNRCCPCGRRVPRPRLSIRHSQPRSNTNAHSHDPMCIIQSGWILRKTSPFREDDGMHVSC